MDISLHALFSELLSAPYIKSAEQSASYCIMRKDGTITVLFEGSAEDIDWDNNIDFAAEPLEWEDGIIYVHRGFLRAFEDIRDIMLAELLSPDTLCVICAGYSHGGALAFLFHELATRVRPDLKGKIQTVAYGAPRVFCGVPTRSLRERFDSFLAVRNHTDIVTHLPPKILGYRHLGHLLHIGALAAYSRIDSHRPENYLQSLKRYEQI